MPNMQTQYYTLEHRDPCGISNCSEVPEGVQFIAILPGAKRVLVVRRGTGLFATYTGGTGDCGPEYFGYASMATFDRLLDEPKPPAVPRDFNDPAVEQLRLYPVAGGGYQFLHGVAVVAVLPMGFRRDSSTRQERQPLALITGTTDTYAIPHTFEIR